MNKVYNEKVTEIFKTNDYDKFQSILGNRTLSDKNYRKLINSMTEEQLIIPILCNEKMEIIDGQHRFSANKLLKKPVYYYVVSGYGIEQVKKANLVSCNWMLSDFLNLHKQLQKPSYSQFEAMMFKHKLRVSQLIEIIAAIEKREYSAVKQSFEVGTFEFENAFEVHNFLDYLDNFKQFKDFKEYNTKAFTKAFLRLYIYEKYDHKLMQKKIANLGYKLSKKSTVGEYLVLLVNDIYSYGSSTVGFKYDIYNNRFYNLKQDQ